MSTKDITSSITFAAGGFITKDGAIKLPKGDVLIHAGDITNQGTSAEFRRSLDWIRQADFEVKVIVAGNHDITLDHTFYAKHHARFHNQNPESTEEFTKLITEIPSLVYLNHESRSIRLTKPDGPRTTFKVFGSPYSPGDEDGWAFRYPRDSTAASKLWDQIPLDTDIVATHTPPRNHRDGIEGRLTGCESLRRALWRVAPRLAVCGHVHPARGYDRVWWDSADNEQFGELCSESGSLPPLESRKQCLVDLTGKKHRRLANDGRRGSMPLFNSKTVSPSKASKSTVVNAGSDDIENGSGHHYPDESPNAPSEPQSNSKAGRRETCIVNAAILANTYPYVGGKKFFRPIIVDLDLPPDPSAEER